jgi:hypothetical protein
MQSVCYMWYSLFFLGEDIILLQPDYDGTRAVATPPAVAPPGDAPLAKSARTKIQENQAESVSSSDANYISSGTVASLVVKGATCNDDHEFDDGTRAVATPPAVAPPGDAPLAKSARTLIQENQSSRKAGRRRPAAAFPLPGLSKAEEEAESVSSSDANSISSGTVASLVVKGSTCNDDYEFEDTPAGLIMMLGSIKGADSPSPSPIKGADCPPPGRSSDIPEDSVPAPTVPLSRTRGRTIAKREEAAQSDDSDGISREIPQEELARQNDVAMYGNVGKLPGKRAQKQADDKQHDLDLDQAHFQLPLAMTSPKRNKAPLTSIGVDEPNTSAGLVSAKRTKATPAPTPMPVPIPEPTPAGEVVIAGAGEEEDSASASTISVESVSKSSKYLPCSMCIEEDQDYVLKARVAGHRTTMHIRDYPGVRETQNLNDNIKQMRRTDMTAQQTRRLGRWMDRKRVLDSRFSHLAMFLHNLNVLQTKHGNFSIKVRKCV